MNINKKQIIKLSILTICCILITLLSIIPFSGKYNKTIWMKDLSDNTLIVNMSIPGTHDSGSMHSIFDVAGKCQDMNFKNQLAIGVRFFDIRLQLVKNELKVVHSFVDQKLSFTKVLKEIDQFIKENSSEFIILSIKEDADPKKSTIDFDEKVIEEVSKYDSISLDLLPSTLGSARGKVYLLNRFTDEEVGINANRGWKDSTSFELGSIFVQDNYCINSVDIKKNDIINAFNYSQNNDKLVFNFTSCYLENSFPPLYAGTPAKDINPWLKDILNYYSNDLGIVIIDFITEEVAKEIYMRNSYEVRN